MKIRFLQSIRLRRLVPSFLKRIRLPGYPEISCYDAVSFYLKKADREDLRMRAAYISFNFLLALFPAVIFFFTLIAYLPFEKAHKDILLLVSTLMPDTAFQSIEAALNDILEKQRTGLLSLGFLAALYFSTSAVDSMIRAFHRSLKVTDKRKLYKRKIYSVLLNFYLSFLLIVSLLLITSGSWFFRWLKSNGIIDRQSLVFLFELLNWMVVLALILAVISSIYSFGPYVKNKRWRFVSPGSIAATCLIVLMSTLLSAYVNNFNAYNKIYGSIGTLIVIMLWIYWNCTVTLIGFDFNILLDQMILKKEDKVPADKNQEEDKEQENRYVGK
jgi:membrane protein